MGAKHRSLREGRSYGDVVILLSIDPGKRTGVAVVRAVEDRAPSLLHHEEVYGGLEGFMAWWDTYHPHYDVLVVENYIPRAGVSQKDSGDPQRVIGWLSQFDPLLRPPAGRKRAVSDDAMKRLGMYLAGEPNRNAREAVRHAIGYLKNSLHEPTLRMGWPE